MDDKSFGTLYSSTGPSEEGTPNQKAAHQILQYAREEGRRTGADKETALDGLLGVICDETGKLGAEIKAAMRHEDAVKFIRVAELEGYSPAVQLRQQRGEAMTLRAQQKFVEDHGIPHKHNGQHWWIHAAKWNAACAKVDREAFDMAGDPAFTMEFIDEAKQRQAAVRKRK
jgi:hypothetical protein